MPKVVEVPGVGNVEFPDSMSDDQISAAIRKTLGSPPPSLSTPKTVGGFASNLGTSAGNFATGIASAVAHPIDTAKNISDVFQGGVVRGAQALGMKEGWSPEAEGRAQKFDAVAQHYKNRYGSPQQAVDTLYSDPVGAAADASMVAGGTAQALRLARLPKLANLSNKVSQATNPIIAAPRAVASVVPKKTRDALAQRLYQSALKPPTGMMSEADEAQMIRTAMDEKVVLPFIGTSESALEKVRGKVDAIDSEVAGTIAKGDAAGKTVDPVKVSGYTKRAEAAFETVDPADSAPIRGVRDRFLDEHTNEYPYTEIRPAVDDATGYVPVGTGVTKEPRPIPVGEAQKLKRNTYREIRDSYGEQSSAVREAKKDLARGLKEEIYNHFPELRALGQKEKALINLESALERFAKRQGNRDLIGIGTPISGGAVSAVTGSPTSGAVAMLLRAAIDQPGVKSRLAIALRASARAKRGPAIGRQATTAATQLNSAAGSEQQQF